MGYYKVFFISVVCMICIQTQSANGSLSDYLNTYSFVINNAWNNLTSEDSDAWKDTSLNFLDQNIVSKLHTDYDSCKRGLEFACGPLTGFWGYKNFKEENLLRQPLSDKLSSIKKDVIEILKEPIYEYETQSLKVEKQLYNDCMKIGERNRNLESRSIVDFAFYNIINNASLKSWKTVDKELASLGFNYTFFRISLIDENILLLEPPSTIELFDSMWSLNRIAKLLKASDKQKQELVTAMHLFTALNRIADKKIEVEEMTPTEWYNYYLRYNGKEIQGHITSEIDWREIFENIFGENTSEIDNTKILVRDLSYFRNLEKFLRLFLNNDEIKMNPVTFIAAKWMMDNLMYLNWDVYHQLHNVNKDYFCMESVPGYSASRKALLSFIQKENLTESYAIAKHIMNQLKEVITTEIDISSSLDQSEKHFLQNYVLEITEFFDDLSNATFVDSLNEHFLVTHNYAIDILNYQKEFEDSLSRLSKHGSTVRLPFHIKDLHRAQNRILLKATLDTYKLTSQNIYKEYNYGRYGAEMARLLHDLLNNKRFNNLESKANDVDWLLSSTKYPISFKKCLIDNNVPLNDTDTILSEVFALQTAITAMLRDYTGKTRDFSLSFKTDVTYKADALFFLAYLQDRCYMNPKIAQYILSLISEYPRAFGCNYQVSLCYMPSF